MSPRASLGATFVPPTGTMGVATSCPVQGSPTPKRILRKRPALLAAEPAWCSGWVPVKANLLKQMSAPTGSPAEDAAPVATDPALLTAEPACSGQVPVKKTRANLPKQVSAPTGSPVEDAAPVATDPALLTAEPAWCSGQVPVKKTRANLPKQMSAPTGSPVEDAAPVATDGPVDDAAPVEALGRHVCQIQAMAWSGWLPCKCCSRLDSDMRELLQRSL